MPQNYISPIIHYDMTADHLIQHAITDSKLVTTDNRPITNALNVFIQQT